jgi:hypothetical protein
MEQLMANLLAKLRSVNALDEDAYEMALGESLAFAPEMAPVAAEDSGDEIVKTKTFAVTPLSPQEAVLQLELVGHDFFVFRNDDSGEVNVVYRRRDGQYGLIEPQ